MKRDWDIIRDVLLALEDSDTPNPRLSAKHFTQHDEQAVAYNMRLLHEAGYIDARFTSSNSMSGHILGASAVHMTNAGHELLDTIRSDTVWSKTKDTFKSKGLDMTFDLVIMVSKKIVESMLS
jgi:Hypothetical protein (DUF2513)